MSKIIPTSYKLLFLLKVLSLSLLYKTTTTTTILKTFTNTNSVYSAVFQKSFISRT